MSKAIEQDHAVARVDRIDAEAPVKERKPHLEQRRKRQPRYHVILWDDNDHTYDYVIRMMHDLFGHPYVDAFRMAKEVDTAGRTVCLTTTLEHAELKRDQIHAYGKDRLILSCQGSMSCTLEPDE
ncbi:MAG: ATP-dependent Clp protease adaptor ClpS [Planctomycetales bacterium]|nr:ATP-dependent Clp protease adaptor ClpS [Planctomycetales bacterium]